MISDPRHRVDMYLRMCEYAYPRMRHTEVSGVDGGPLEVVVVHELRKADK